MNRKPFMFRIIMLTILSGFLVLAGAYRPVGPALARSEPDVLEQELFTREEFFGAEAIVPLPTLQARANLARLTVEHPDRVDILKKLAEADEKLGSYAEAENGLIRLSGIDPASRYELADFYHRRGRYADECKVLSDILAGSQSTEKSTVFDRLFTLARTHDLKEFRSTEFLRQTAADNAEVLDVLVRIVDGLSIEEEKEEALKTLRQARSLFPDRARDLLKREVELLTALGRADEAEPIYESAFDPFWTEDETDAFYSFLSDRDRLREYGWKLKDANRNDPANFRTAVRYAHYRSHRYEDPNPILLKLEKIKTAWTADELLSVARLLIRSGNGNAASRFLYTLVNREDFRQKGEIRSRVIYQLFEIFSDADDQDLPLADGDLSLYRNIAAADSNPGISTSILSLLFADSDIGRQFDQREAAAQKHFNRAAAYRLFRLFREENPASAEAAQMHLDIVRLYAADDEPKIAEQTLNEFKAAYKMSADYADAALKLADAYNAVSRFAEARAVYAEALDHLAAPAGILGGVTKRNEGIKIPSQDRKENYLNYRSESRFRDHLGPMPPAVTYHDVLLEYIDSLSGEKKTADILELLSGEIRKHPDVEWLYETRLEWLEKTNLTEDQLAAHRQALDRFQSATWRDKLARWLLRQNRKAEFSSFSTDLIERLDEAGIKEFMTNFAESSGSSAFDTQLRLQLYLSARRRFPHEPAFVTGLLRLYSSTRREAEWGRLAAENYFLMEPVRKLFLDRLAERGELRAYLANATGDNAVYKLFRADAAMRLSNFEQAVAAYRELNSAYPNSPEFSEPLIALTRSFGQRSPTVLEESAFLAVASADHLRSSSELRTRGGELYAELGDFENARVEWNKVPKIEAGRPAAFQSTAAVFWDYFQYNDALRTIEEMRNKFGDQTLSAFEAGAIRESLHDRRGAIAEYVKSLDSPDSTRAIKRLKRLGKNADGEKQISATYQKEIADRRDGSRLALGYAAFLQKTGKNDDADAVLIEAVSASRDAEFLTSAREFFSAAERRPGERFALRRLAEISDAPRRKIGYLFDIAESLFEDRDREGARKILRELNDKYPDNAGVIFETAEFYKRLGLETDGVLVLQRALQRSGRQYRGKLAMRLSQMLVFAGRDADAELILKEQHRTDKHDLSLFRELANVAVRLGHSDLLREAFAETLSALKASGVDRRELDAAVAELRSSMIGAFSRLGDHRSAIEQHIELINREPEDEELISSAIAYAGQHGGGEFLLEYYVKTSAQAFKNYRWNVVLARIHESKGDSAAAIKCYRDAIVNQPEMADLYSTVAMLETRLSNYDGAIKDIDKSIELSNGDPEYVKKKIEILKKAGRHRDAASEAEKLPKTAAPMRPADGLSAALALEQTDSEQAAAAFRSAFAALMENPLQGELTAAGINGYINSARHDEGIDIILTRLWNLREKLIAISLELGSPHAGEARGRLSVLDGTIVESVGNILSSVGMDEELAAVNDFLSREVDVAVGPNSSHSLVRSLSRRGGLGRIEESVLLKAATSATGPERQYAVRDLVAFYKSRGAYATALGVIEQLQSDDLRSIAKFARLTGATDKELTALCSIYFKPAEKPPVEPDADVARFLELLFKNNRDELARLADRSSAYQIQLINFLLAKSEKELVHRALESSGMSVVWKLSRHAEASLALREFGPETDCYFCDALRLQPIGRMIAEPPDAGKYPVGDDWFRLAREYGEWLYHSRDRAADADSYLVALTENQPRNAARQTELANFHLGQGRSDAAIAHYRLAIELAPNDPVALARLGAAYARAGRIEWAREMWNRASAGAGPEDLGQLFAIALDAGVADEARRFVLQAIVRFLSQNNTDGSDDFRQVVRDIAASIDDAAAKSRFFEEIIYLRPRDLSLSEFLLDEDLVAPEYSAPFFERVTAFQGESDYYGSDYEYEALARRTWTRIDAESIYDHETDFDPPAPDNDLIARLKKYLTVLLALKNDAKAAEICAKIERLIDRRYARPEWLRLVQMRLDIRSGRFVQADAERFVGITAAETVPNIKPPSIERLNEAVRLLKEEGRDPDPLTAAFYARRLALGDHAAENFAGLILLIFKQGDTGLAVQLLDIFAGMADPGRQPESAATVENIDLVKKYAADKTKTGEPPFHAVSADARSLAADIASANGQTEKAIQFRQAQRLAVPSDTDNSIKLAGLLHANGDRKTAENILREIAANRKTTRNFRWLARWELHRIDPALEMPFSASDAYALFYRGTALRDAGSSGEAVVSFVDSLIAGNGPSINAKEQLIKIHAATGSDHAAIELATSGGFEKKDEILRMLSASAERIGNLAAAIEFEEQLTNADAARLSDLKQRLEASTKPLADLKVDLNNTRIK